MNLFFRGRCAVFFGIAYAAALKLANARVAAVSTAAAQFRFRRTCWPTECGLAAALAPDRAIQ